MKETLIKFVSKPELSSPIVIEGLPGIGLVGKIAADHLLSKKKAKLFCELYSPHFPPQVITDKKGIVRLVKNEFHHFRENGQDYIIIAGDFQGMTPESQYEISGKIIDVLKPYKPKGRVVKKPKVFGAANRQHLIEPHKKQGIIFEGREGGGIFGASGLVLGLGAIENIDAICLMGETVGQVVDAKSAKVLLEKLAAVLCINVDMTDLDKQAKITEKELKKIQKLQEEQAQALQMAMTGQDATEDDVQCYIR